MDNCQVTLRSWDKHLTLDMSQKLYVYIYIEWVIQVVFQRARNLDSPLGYQQEQQNQALGVDPVDQDGHTQI